MKLRLATLLALTCLAGTSAHAATNLVVNGSFEGANGLAGWTTGGSVGDTYLPVAIAYGQVPGGAYPTGAQGETVPADSVTTSPSPDAAGAKGVYFVTDQAHNLSLYQKVFLTPGSYDIGFDSYDTFNGAVQPADANLTANIAGVTLANFALSSVTPGAWSTHSGVADITAAGDYLVSFNFATPFEPEDAKDVIVDRVYVIADSAGGGQPIPPVTGTPEPATWAVFLLGMGVMGAVLRSRKAGARSSASLAG